MCWAGAENVLALFERGGVGCVLVGTPVASVRLPLGDMLVVCLVSVCLSLRESSGSEILTCKELCISTPYL